MYCDVFFFLQICLDSWVHCLSRTDTHLTNKVAAHVYLESGARVHSSGTREHSMQRKYPCFSGFCFLEIWMAFSQTQRGWRALVVHPTKHTQRSLITHTWSRYQNVLPWPCTLSIRNNAGSAMQWTACSVVVSTHVIDQLQRRTCTVTRYWAECSYCPVWKDIRLRTRLVDENIIR